jgi:hypothetical protein
VEGVDEQRQLPLPHRLQRRTGPVREGEAELLVSRRQRTAFVLQQFRFAFPDRACAALETVRERELALLVDALHDLPAYELRHPYPVDLHDLYDAADPYC